MTVQDVLNQVDTLVPNAVSQEVKLACIASAEAMVADLLDPGAEELPQTLPLDRELKVPFPWDGVYRHFVEMRIHYLLGDIPRYNQAQAMFQAVYSGYRDHCNRSRLGEKTAIRYF